MAISGTWTRAACKSAKWIRARPPGPITRLPGLQYRGHGLTQDRERRHLGRGPHGVRARRQQDRRDQILSVRSRSQAAAARQHSFVDSKQNIWEIALLGRIRLQSGTATTGEVSVYKTPTDNSFAYGMVMDKNDKVWLADWWRCKVTKFDPADSQWIE